MQISTNLDSLRAVAALYTANAKISQASERISTGLRVNSAADDPVGLGMANRLNAQVGSFSKVLDNVSQGASMVKIVDDSLTQIQDLLGYMRVAAVAAQSSTASTSDIAAYQDSIDAYVSEIGSISGNAIWNGTSLMSTASSMSIQSGINSGDTTTLTFDKVTATVLGVNSLDVSTSASAAVTAIDTAIDTVATYQAYIGAETNILGVQTNLANNNITNLSGAYGNIMNADMAQETANLAAAQIQRDAATAMLAQSSNINKDLVTFLLKSTYN